MRASGWRIPSPQDRRAVCRGWISLRHYQVLDPHHRPPPGRRRCCRGPPCSAPGVILPDPRRATSFPTRDNRPYRALLGWRRDRSVRFRPKRSFSGFGPNFRFPPNAVGKADQGSPQSGRPGRHPESGHGPIRLFSVSQAVNRQQDVPLGFEKSVALHADRRGKPTPIHKPRDLTTVPALDEALHTCPAQRSGSVSGSCLFTRPGPKADKSSRLPCGSSNRSHGLGRIRRDC